MGNICRSPTAEGVFRHLLMQAGLQHRVRIDSAGTHAYHIGKAPDARATETAMRRRIDLSDLRARQLDDGDFYYFDYILAADARNLSRIRESEPERAKARLGLLMDFAPPGYPAEVPDPYFGAGDGFERVLDMVTAACEGLLSELRQQM
jgi:protein-tyrosine phosphatase